MSIISTIGRKQNKVRGLFLGMYLFLIIGGATMVYPFLLMISGSMKSAMDIKHFDICPRFLYDRDWMWGKHAEGLFNESLGPLKYAYNETAMAFDKLGEQPPHNAVRAEAWESFVKECPMPDYAYAVGYCGGYQSKTIPYCRREFKNMLDEKFGGDLSAVNRTYQTEFSDWQAVTIAFPTMYMRRNKPYETAYSKVETEFLSKMPIGLRTYFSPRGFFVRMFLKARYAGAKKADGLRGTPLEEYNDAHGTSYVDWKDVPFPRRFPVSADKLSQEEWEQYVRHVLCTAWIRVDGTALGAFQAYLRAKYPDADGRQGLDILNERYGTSYGAFADVPVSVGNVEAHRRELKVRFGNSIDAFNRSAGTSYADFADLPLAEVPPFTGAQGTDWDGFIVGFSEVLPDGKRGKLLQAPVECLRVQDVDTLFQDWIMATYGTVEKANAALGTAWKDVENIGLLQKDAHLKYMDDHIGDLRLEFVTRNYKAVLDYVLFHGRGILNTVIFCGLSILVALLVNPLAAYAMSRYRMPSSYKILLFLMCTMAFPPMVTAIPNFIMLRQFNLLNTFWALILPGMANGYSIFLLKGFFDSLPQELYESAQLDGATEWTLFWQITMGLSKPILAVIALNAFMGSYAAYMFAFVICQDKKMWTLMVWLYEMQQNYGQGVVYASLVIAAVPTFLIFLFCQNIIMRGIVVPSEK